MRGFWAAVLLSIACLPTPDAAAQDISWARYSKPCKPAAQQASLVVPAGDYGVFYFGSSPFTACPQKLVAGCTEEPPIYPPPGPAPMDSMLACDPATSGCNKKFADMNGSWVTVVDWDNWHGKSVDALIRASTDPTIQTMLLPLEDHFPQYKDTITDADVLIHLAELVEAVDRQGTPRPLVVNMSFGRLHEPHDALNSKCDETVCGDGSLSCQLARILKYVTRATPNDKPSTVVVASRGNDVLELGPGEYDEVLSVGITDLTELAADGTVVPAWESPPKSAALMPGGGFCLGLDPIGGPPGSFDNPMPTGSSYSSAIFAGMIAEQLLRDPYNVKPHLDGNPLWTPRSPCPDNGCPFFLNHNGKDFPILSGRGNALIMDIVTGNLSNCGLPAYPTELLADLVAAGAEPYVYPTLPELTVGTHRPTPETNGCVPCGGCCQVFPLSAPADKEADPGGKSRKSSRAPITIRLTIDMHSAWYLDQELTLQEVYLRVGQELRLAVLSQSQRDMIAAGQVNKLKLKGIFYALDMNAQPSLIFVVSHNDDPDQWFWKSTPVYLEPSP